MDSSKSKKYDIFAEAEHKDKSTKRKKRIKRSLFIGIPLLVILLVIGIGMLYLNQIIGDAIIINIENIPTSFYLTNGETSSTTVTASVTLNSFCKASCTNSITDISSNRVLSTKTSLLQGLYTFKENLTLEAPEFGSGTRLYEYRISCHSINSQLCKTDESETQKTLLFTLEHSPSNDIQQKQAKLSTKYSELILGITENQILKSRILNQNGSNDPYQLTAYDEQLSDTKQVWQTEKLDEFSNKLDELRKFQILEKNEIVQTYKNKEQDLVQLQNSLEKYQINVQSLLELEKITKYLQERNDNSNSNAEDVQDTLRKSAVAQKRLQAQLLLINFDDEINTGLISNNTIYEVNAITTKIQDELDSVHAIQLKQILTDRVKTSLYCLLLTNMSGNICDDSTISSIANDSSLSVTKGCVEINNAQNSFANAISILRINNTQNSSVNNYNNNNNNDTNIITENNITNSINNFTESLNNTEADVIIPSSLISLIRGTANSESSKLTREKYANNVYEILDSIANEHTLILQNTTFVNSKVLYRVVFNDTNDVTNNALLSLQYVQLFLPQRCSVTNNSALLFKYAAIQDKIDLIHVQVQQFEEIISADYSEEEISRMTQFQAKYTLPDLKKQCCYYNTCKPCCITDECQSNIATYPVLLLHGHAFSQDISAEKSLNTFSVFQNQLSKKGYISAGSIYSYQDEKNQNMIQNDWKSLPFPMSITASYYYDYYTKPEQIQWVQIKSENIETYAIRLAEIVESIKKLTGKEKVIIVAHSMGGLVATRYVQLFGNHSVAGIVTVGTPFGGMEGKIQKACDLKGNDLECRDLTKGSLFLNKLYVPIPVELHVIAGTGCSMSTDAGNEEGDGVVLLKNSKFPLATEMNSYAIINGSCSGFDLYHNRMIESANEKEMQTAIFTAIDTIINDSNTK